MYRAIERLKSRHDSLYKQRYSDVFTTAINLWCDTARAPGQPAKLNALPTAVSDQSALFFLLEYLGSSSFWPELNLNIHRCHTRKEKRGAETTSIDPAIDHLCCPLDTQGRQGLGQLCVAPPPMSQHLAEHPVCLQTPVFDSLRFSQHLLRAFAAHWSSSFHHIANLSLITALFAHSQGVKLKSFLTALYFQLPILPQEFMELQIA